MIVLRALGNAEIETAVTTLTPSREIVFAAALYLILERGKRVSRARLASILWPRVAEKARAHRLRQTILQLKKLGITVCADSDTLRLEKEEACTDFDDFPERDLPLAEKQELFEFLPGYNPAFSEEFRDWIDSKREQSHSALTRHLLSTLQLARDSGNWMEVEQISGRCLALDAYNEVAVLARAEAYAMRGQKAAGVSLLDRYIEEMAPRNPDLAVPATILRKRVIHHFSSQTKHLITNEPAFVGREAEMAMLTRFLHNAQKGRGGGCLVNGDPGIGKTRLSFELAKFADLQGIRVERVACKRADMHQPLSAFVGLVPGLRELPGALGCSQKSVAWLKRLTEFDVSSDELPTRADDSTSPYTNLRSAVFDLLDAVSEEGCLLVIVEDVQWLDRTSISLFGAILEWAAVKRLFFVFTSREARIPLMESSPQVAPIHLRPLGNGEAASLIRTMMTSVKSHPDADALAWLINAGDGNPFFLQELTKQWAETGQRLELPHSVATVLDERISRLSGVARQLIEACAVLGENSNLERLEHVLEYPSHDLLAGLQELSTAGMLRAVPATVPVTQSLLIRHDLLSIEVLNGLAPASLAFLHRRCGLALERELLGSSISTSLLRACAFHWHHSGDSGRAYGLAVKCANHLLEIGLALDAVTAFEGALVFCSTVEAQLDVLGRIVHALRMARDWPGILKHVARIRALQDFGPQTNHHDELEILEFEARRTTEIAIAPLLSRTLTCVYDAGLPPSHRVRVASDAFKLATVLPDLKELERAYVAIKPLLTESSVDLRSRLQVEVVYNAMCGDLTEAARLAKERVAFERVEARPLLLANALTDLAFVLRRTGPDEEISSVLQEAYDIAIQSKLFAAARDYAERMLAFLVDSGREGVETWMQRANESHGDGVSVRSTFSVNAYQVRIALLENRIDDAQRILQRAFDWEWVRHRKGWLAATTALRIRAEISLRSTISSLRPIVDELRQLYEETAMLGGQDYEIAALCAGLCYIGEKTAAEGYLRDYLYQTRRDLTRYSKELTEISRTLAIDPTHERESGVATIA